MGFINAIIGLVSDPRAAIAGWIAASPLDLQIDVEGREAFKVATGSLTLVQEFDEKDDYDLVDSDASIAGDLADDKFALFVAGEPHMPTLEFPGDGAQPVKKICFKLLADAYWEE